MIQDNEIGDLFDFGGGGGDVVAVDRKVEVKASPKRAVKGKPKIERVNLADVPEGADRIRVKSGWAVSSGCLWEAHAYEIGERWVDDQILAPHIEEGCGHGVSRVKLPLWLFPGERVSCRVCGQDLSDMFYVSREEAEQVKGGGRKMAVVIVVGGEVGLFD